MVNKRGAFFALIAYLAWGFFPLYWKPLKAVPPLEILAHRVVWSFVFLTAIVLLRKRGSEIVTALKDLRVLGKLAISTTAIATNWYIYIWAVNNDRVLHASFGYFITPLINVLLGLVFFREKLRPLQWVSVGLAAAGVVWLGLALEGVPWVAMILALSFGLYGLVRKTAKVDSLIGLTLETTLLTPLAAVFLWRSGTTLNVLLLGAGVVTALPLLWFATAARLLPMSVLGFFQYLAPTVQFLIGAFWFGEPLSRTQLVAFGFIWVAVACFALSGNLRQRRVDLGDLRV